MDGDRLCEFRLLVVMKCVAMGGNGYKPLNLCKTLVHSDTILTSGWSE